MQENIETEPYVYEDLTRTLCVVDYQKALVIKMANELEIAFDVKTILDFFASFLTEPDMHLVLNMFAAEITHIKKKEQEGLSNELNAYLSNLYIKYTEAILREAWGYYYRLNNLLRTVPLGAMASFYSQKLGSLKLKIMSESCLYEAKNIFEYVLNTYIEAIKDAIGLLVRSASLNLITPLSEKQGIETGAVKNRRLNLQTKLQSINPLELSNKTLFELENMLQEADYLAQEAAKLKSTHQAQADSKVVALPADLVEIQPVAKLDDDTPIEQLLYQQAKRLEREINKLSDDREKSDFNKLLERIQNGPMLNGQVMIAKTCLHILSRLVDRNDTDGGRKDDIEAGTKQVEEWLKEAKLLEEKIATCKTVEGVVARQLKEILGLRAAARDKGGTGSEKKSSGVSPARALGISVIMGTLGLGAGVVLSSKINGLLNTTAATSGSIKLPNGKNADNNAQSDSGIGSEQIRTASTISTSLVQPATSVTATKQPLRIHAPRTYVVDQATEVYETVLCEEGFRANGRPEEDATRCSVTSIRKCVLETLENENPYVGVETCLPAQQHRKRRPRGHLQYLDPEVTHLPTPQDKNEEE